jgi:hypothetical protein
VSAATSAPSHLPIHEDPGRVAAWSDAELAELAAWLADDTWLDEDAGPPAGYVVEDPEQDGPEPAGPEPESPEPESRAPVEVWKAGRWDRSRGDGGGFAAGGMADHLPPGPVLAGLANDTWQAGLGRLSDDELIGVLRAARRLASWAAAMELAATADLWARRTAEEDAGDTGVAEHADDEVAAALTLTRHAAEQALNLAVALRRLPATQAALRAGDIDLPRAKVIAEELTGLDDRHAAAVEAAIIGAAPGQTTGQLRAATRRAAQAADPGAARTRKEQALREARVERWTEPAGTAALAGRDLPPAQVLAADANLTALAQQLKAAGGEGTLDTLRAKIYLALLTGMSAAALLPARADSPTAPAEVSGNHDGARRGGGGQPDDTGHAGDVGPAGDTGPAGDVGSAGDAVLAGDVGPATGSGSALGANSPAASALGPGANSPAVGVPSPGTNSPAASVPSLGTNSPAASALSPGANSPPASVLGRVHLTLPLKTWLGQSDAPGQVAGYGPLDATDSRALADALAAHAGTKWCLTITGPDGRPVAHGCARAAPPAGSRTRPGTGSRDGPLAGGRSSAGSRDGPPTSGQSGAGSRDGPLAGGRSSAGSRDGPLAGGQSGAGSRDGPKARARDRSAARSPAWAWTFTVTPLDGGSCDHAWETPAYRPSDALRHLVSIRHATCIFPGCRRPAAQCDADHTLAYESGGKTCLCNLAPLCRHHHQVKQTPGWALDHITPGVLTWTAPSGRRYTTTPTSYLE